jgi:hypothetical protein
MSLKHVFAVMIIILSTHITGCAKITGCTTYITSLYSPTGKNRVTVGEVGVRASSASSGDTADGTLIVSADEIGNAIISAGKDTLAMEPLALNDKDRNEAIEILKNLKKIGDTEKQEKAEVSQYVGALSSDMGLLHGSAIIGIDCISPAEGKAWMGKMSFCYSDLRVIGTKKPAGTSPCDKEIDMYLSHTSTSTLLSLLEMVPLFTIKAKAAASKE